MNRMYSQDAFGFSFVPLCSPKRTRAVNRRFHEVNFNHKIENQIAMRDLLWLIAIILFVGWLLGYQGCGAAMGDFIHILLVLAIVVVLIRLIGGRRL